MKIDLSVSVANYALRQTVCFASRSCAQALARGMAMEVAPQWQKCYNKAKREIEI
jgi:hypothetical protein